MTNQVPILFPMTPEELSAFRFLVVDDSGYARSFVREALKAFDLRNVEEAADPADAIKVLRDEPVDFVITDHIMTPMTGIELTQHVRWADDLPNPTIPILMMSSCTDTKTVIEAMNAGIHEFLAKPFSSDSLFRRVRHTLENPRPFVMSPKYRGPCRRFRKDPNYCLEEEKRRAEGQEGVEIISPTRLVPMQGETSGELRIGVGKQARSVSLMGAVS